MDFAELAGKVLTLDAVDFDNAMPTTRYGEPDTANGLRFRLDGVVYEAIEDDKDDYRSSLGELRRAEDGTPMVNTFTPTHVKCEHVTSQGGYDVEGEQFTWYVSRRECDILCFTATGNGRVVLEVGTDNTDDYYPTCVLSFFPQDLPANAGVSR